MSRKFALVIGNTEYNDSGLAQLKSPGKDAEDFARVLRSAEICGFDDVKVSLNQPSSSVIEAIDEFFDEKKPDDMLVLYFSGHGVKDESGSLYLAFKNTARSRLRSTAIKSDYIRDAMDQSRSKRQLLILDCCNSGAFPQGTKAEIGGTMGMTKAFQGYGRFVLTASDATQFAWEGDKVIGQTENSLFTHFLVKGLEGEADTDGNGKITVDELYDYIYQQISKVTPKQTPTKSSSKQEGEIVLRQNMRVEDIKPIPLPDDLINEIEDTRPYVREIAVQKLDKIIKGKNIGLARSAREALEKIISDEDTTRRVAQSATLVLERSQIEQKMEEKQFQANVGSTPLRQETAEPERKFEEDHPSVEKPQHEKEISAKQKPEEIAPNIPTKDSAAPGTNPVPKKKNLNLIPIGCFALLVVAFFMIVIGYGAIQSSIKASNASNTQISFAATQRAIPTATERPTSTLTPRPIPTSTKIPTQIPTNASQGTGFELIDLFSNNSNTWGVGNANNEFGVYNTRIDSGTGTYIFEITEAKQGFVLRDEPGSIPEFKNMAVAAKAKLDSGDPFNFCYGVFFRKSSNGYYIFEICEAQIFKVEYVDLKTNEWTKVIDWTAATSIKKGDWNLISVGAVDNSLAFIINDTKVGSIQDSRGSSGTAGILIETFSGEKGKVSFDGFTVSEVR